MRSVKMLCAGLLALALMAAPAFADPLTNPWADDGAQVGVTITVGQLGEVWSSIGTGQARSADPNASLSITNAGGFIPAAGIAEDSLYHYANVAYQVSVHIVGDIPEWSRFHVLVGVNNRGDYNSVFAGLPGQTDVAADKVITWDRRDAGTGYLGGNVPGTPVAALTGAVSTAANTTLVDYAADAIHGLPPVGDKDVTVVWTIASTP